MNSPAEPAVHAPVSMGDAPGQTGQVGGRGGADYDYLPLVAVRKAGAKVLRSINARHFAAVWRPGDPQVLLSEH